MSRSILSGVCAVALAATTACAQENPLPQSGPQSGDGEEGASVRLTPAIIDAAQVTTRTDAEIYAASEFKQADLDQNGSVDENEFIAYAAVKAPLEDAPTGDMAALEGEPEGDAAGPASAEEQFAEISKGDDAITETDMVEARVADFEAADANKDDVLDDAERAQFASLVSLKTAQTSL